MLFVLKLNKIRLQKRTDKIRWFSFYVIERYLYVNDTGQATAGGKFVKERE